MKKQYRWRPTVSVIKADPIMNRLVPKALHRGPSGEKSPMWKANRTILSRLIEKLPRRYTPETKVREFHGELKEMFA